jgi:hypothetical protein
MIHSKEFLKGFLALHNQQAEPIIDLVAKKIFAEIEY